MVHPFFGPGPASEMHALIMQFIIWLLSEVCCQGRLNSSPCLDPESGFYLSFALVSAQRKICALTLGR